MSSSPVIEIVDLVERPDCLNNLIRWSFSYWQKPDPLWSEDEWRAWYSEVLDRTTEPLPRCWVALIDGEIAGAVSLVVDGELADQTNLSPWLDGLIVNPRLRKSGIGSLLVKHCEEHAKLMGIQVLYLWTEAQSTFYKKRNWKLREETHFRQIPIALMERELS